MSDTLACVSQVKERNVYEVKAALYRMDSGTKQSVAQATGLSITTCNSILNELYESNEVLLAEEPYRKGVGRPARAYRINKDYRYACCLNILRGDDTGTANFHYVVLNMVGEIMEDKDLNCPNASFQELEHILQELIRSYPQIHIICLGVAGFYDCRALQSSWFSPEKGYDIVRNLSAALNRKVIVENDMNAIAYGAYKDLFYASNRSVSSLVVISFFDRNGPGAGIIYHGQILHGHRNFAGEISYLPFFHRKESSAQDPEEADLLFEALTESIESVTAVLAPEICILVGECLSQEIVDRIPEACSPLIPQNVLPELIYCPHYQDFFIDGLYHIALDYIMKASL